MFNKTIFNWIAFHENHSYGCFAFFFRLIGDNCRFQRRKNPFFPIALSVRYPTAWMDLNISNNRISLMREIFHRFSIAFSFKRIHFCSFAQVFAIVRVLRNVFFCINRTLAIGNAKENLLRSFCWRSRRDENVCIELRVKIDLWLLILSETHICECVFFCLSKRMNVFGKNILYLCSLAP